MHRRGVIGLPLAILGACAGPPAAPLPPVPSQGGLGAADPARQAVLVTSYAFADPSRLAGRPAAAARAAAQLEWLAVALPRNQAWIPASPTLFPLLGAARAELRGALGVDLSLPAAEPVRRLQEAAAALDAGDRAAASRLLGPGGGEAMLARLDRLPPLPAAAQATRLAEIEMERMMRDDPGD
jgi:hypothetical protein